jgi:hypothetical protein
MPVHRDSYRLSLPAVTEPSPRAARSIRAEHPTLFVATVWSQMQDVDIQLLPCE